MSVNLLMWAHCARQLCNKSLEPLMQELDLSAVELVVLFFLVDNPEWDTSRDIAEKTMLAKSNVSTAVDRLVQRGYLVRQPDLTDRRRIHLKPQASARRIAERGAAARTRMIRQVLAGFTPEEIQWMRHMGGRMEKNVQEMLKKRSNPEQNAV